MSGVRMKGRMSPVRLFSVAGGGSFRGFRRLLTFKIPHTDRFYHRFGLLHAPNVRPILCMGTQESQYLFWDMQRLEEGIDPQDRPLPRAKKRAKQRKGTALLGDLQRRSESVNLCLVGDCFFCGWEGEAVHEVDSKNVVRHCAFAIEVGSGNVLTGLGLRVLISYVVQMLPVDLLGRVRAFWGILPKS